MAVPRWRREFAMAEIVESREGKRGFLFQRSFPCCSEKTRDCVDALCSMKWAVFTVLALNTDQRRGNRGPGIWRSWLPQAQGARGSISKTTAASFNLQARSYKRCSDLVNCFLRYVQQLHNFLCFFF